MKTARKSKNLQISVPTEGGGCDLTKYVKKRKASNPEFAEGFDEGYENFLEIAKDLISNPDN